MWWIRFFWYLGMLEVWPDPHLHLATILTFHHVSSCYCWWLFNPGSTHQLRLVVFPIIYRVSAPSQVVGNGISAINSPNPSFGTWIFFVPFFSFIIFLMPTRFPDLFYGFETFFNTMFFFELLVNMYAFWCCRFWKSGLGAQEFAQTTGAMKQAVGEKIRENTCYLGFVAKYSVQDVFCF